MARKLTYIYILFFLFLLSRCFSLATWNYTLGPITLDAVAASMVVYALYHFNYITKSFKTDAFSKLIVLLGCLPFVTVFVKMLFSNDPFASEVQATLVMAMTFFSYFFIKRHNLSEKECLGILIAFGIATFFIQVYQLTVMDLKIFGYTEEGGSGTRNGIARLSIGCILLASFLVYYFWNKTIECKSNKKTLYIILFAAFVTSLYLYLTRQCLIAVFATIILSVMLQKSRKLKVWTFIFIIVLFILGYIYYDVLFADMVEMTETDTYSTDIRLVAYPFFIDLIFSDPIRMFVGHAHLSYIMALGPSKGLWAIDLGIIGEMYHYGIIWGIAYFWTLMKIWKNRKKLPLYLKLYGLGTFIHSPMIGAYTNGITAFVWVVYLYLVGLYINGSNAKIVKQ